MMMNSRLSSLLLAASGMVLCAAPALAAPRHVGVQVRHGLPGRTLVPVAVEGAGGAVLPSSASISQPGNHVILAIGRGQLVSLPGAMKDVFVADEKIADVQVKSNNQLYIYGRGPGETTIYASNAAGAVIWSANVRVANNIDSVDQMLHVAMPDAKVTVSSIGSGTLMLTGTVRAPEDAAEAERLVKAYVGKEANIITRLRTATPLQVNLQVRIAEVSRSLSKTLGSNLATSNSANGFQYGIGQGRSTIASSATSSAALGVGVNPYYYGTDPTAITATNPLGLTKMAATGISTLSTATTLAAQGHLLGLDIIASLDAGEQVGLVTTLAQPNLTALSGETGEFLAGGEFPIPVSSGLGTVSIDYKKYGVSLSYTPTILADGRISLHVRPEVSELSSQGAVTLNGYTVPALTTRRAETSVELGSGQSMMIAGLLSNKASNTIQKLPGVGDIPVLGTLFKSTGFQKGETELVIVITPYLVRPVNDADIKLPTDGLQTPDDIQRVAANMLNGNKSAVARPGPTAAPSETPATAQPAAKRNSAAAQTQAPGFSLN